jgi:septum formation protein
MKRRSAPPSVPLILASGSPRRKSLLRKAGFRFVVKPSAVSEASEIANPSRRVESLALRKAQAVSKTITRGLVLGADTLVVLGSRILGKPIDSDDAYRMLYRLSGSTHRVITGVALVDAASGKTSVSSAESKVRMKKLPLERLLVLSRRHLDKAGSYAIQEKNDPIASVIKGSYDNVVGLPVDLVKKMIAKMRSR